MRRNVLWVCLLLVVLSMGAVGLSAQAGGSLAYGSAQVGTISATSPLVFFSFPGTAGDLVSIEVLSLTPGFDPSLSLLAPSQQPIAANDNDPNTPGALDARIARRLDSSGTYALLVGGSNGTTGDFLIKLNGLQAGDPAALPPGSAAVADFTASPLPQTVAIPVDPAAAVVLTLAANPATFAYNAQVYGPDGALVGLVTGAPQTSFTLPAVAGTAVLMLQPVSPDSTGTVQISTGGAAPSGSAPATPVPVGNAPSGTCTLNSNGSVNLRNGPGTNYGTVGSLTPGVFLPVQGISPDRGWYAVAYNGAQAWVSASVTTLNGPCGNLSTIQPPASPPTTAPGQPTATAIATATAIGLATATATVTPLADTQPPTQAATATPPPVAPPDNDYQVQLDRNNGGSFSQQISYPDGDRSDRITVSVSNFDSINTFAQFAVTLVCTGTGSEFVRWGENQSQNLACGQNLVLTLNNESNQRFLNVTLPDGSGQALVNYTLVFVKVG